MVQGLPCGTGGGPLRETVAAVDLMRVSVPMATGHHSAVASQVVRESVLVRVVGVDGAEGVAECPTLSQSGYVTESTDEAWAALTGGMAAAWLAGMTPPAHAAPAAAAAMSDAVLDLGLRRGGVSLHDHLAELVGTGVRRALRWTAVLAVGGGDPAALTAAGAAALGEGASMLKAKADGVMDLELKVAALRDCGAAAVAIDANGTLDEGDLHRIDGLGLSYVEQPLPAGLPWQRIAEAASGCSTPLALDESLVSPDSVADALRAGAMQVANIKPARVGGVVAAARCAALCAAAGVECFVGGMFELGLGRAAAVSVAALESFTMPTDLAPSHRYFATDICDPIGTDAGGMVEVPHGPGCGRELRGDRVEQFVVDRVRIGS